MTPGTTAESVCRKSRTVFPERKMPLSFCARPYGHGHERADENCREKLAYRGLSNSEGSCNRRNGSYLAAYRGEGAEAEVSQFGNQLVKISRRRDEMERARTGLFNDLKRRS